MATQRMLPESPYFTVERVSGEDIYAAIAKPGMGMMGNAGIVDLGGSTLVVDTGFTPAAARELNAVAEQLTGHVPTYVLNTHYHGDHVFGNAEFPSAEIISTERTRELIAGRSAQFLGELRAERGQHSDLEEAIDHATDERLRRALVESFGDIEAIDQQLDEVFIRLPDLTFERKMVLHGATHRAEVVTYGGGHTPSDAFVVLRGDGVVFLGDLLFVRAHPSLFYGDLDEWVRILNEIDLLDFEYAVPGHGPIGSHESLMEMREYIADLTALARKAVEQVVSEDDAAALPIPEAYEAWEGSDMFALNMRALYQREKALRQIERQVAESDQAEPGS